MRTSTIIEKTKNKIREKKSNVKKLARDYIDIPTKNTERERSIINRIKAEKKEKNEFEHLLKRLNNRKKTMPTMVWKRNRSLEENILDNLDA